MNKLFKRIKRKIFGNTNRDFLIMQMPKNAIFAEIGTWKGDFAKRVIQLSNPSKLFLIDPYEFVGEYKDAWYGGKLAGGQQDMDDIYNTAKARFKKEVDAGKVKIIKKKSGEACKDIKDGLLDWVYIDGNHTYQYVKQDLNNYYPKVKINGFITGDDYINTLWFKDGVTKAVNEFVESHKGKIELVEIKNEQFILKKLG